MGARGASSGEPAVAPIVAALVERHGEAQRPRIERGVAQAASLWRPEEDGDLKSFAEQHFVADPATLDVTFARLQTAFEQLDGHLNEIGRELKRPAETEMGPLMPVDALWSAFDPWAHYSEDLFRSKIAFVALLNFPLTRLQDRLRDGPSYSRRQWAEVRLAGRFFRRVPGEVQQELARAVSEADLYVAQYNIWAHHLIGEGGQRPFPPKLRLITHWNLRDQIRADYADPKGLPRQRLMAQVMSHIVTQTIPRAVIDNPRLDWNPAANEVMAAPAEEVEEGAPAGTATVDPEAEPDTRYARLLDVYRAARRADPYSPIAPTAIARSFEVGREIPEERVVSMLTQVLTSPLVGQVAKVIEARLGRSLEPHDIWYQGFLPRGKFTEEQLDQLTRKKYPTAEAYAADIPNLLVKLGFTRERARYLASKIKVDASRGAGHAMQAMHRQDFSRLRTRVAPGGMDYKGYNIAVHEMGHNVEQVFSLYDVDHTLLMGVPNNAFTEALAFVFQARDLELLGLSKPDAESERLRVLHDFWQTYEIAGVALVDVAAWRWMYENPDATPAELREAVVSIARDLWNRHYAPVVGGKDSVLLGVYSHMLSNPLYLSDYPLGHLIAFQIEEHLRKHKGPLGPEFERMSKTGAVTPDVWMIAATGAPVSPDPLLRAAAEALKAPSQ